MISTHTPLAGRDCMRLLIGYIFVFISTHTPLAGRDYTRIGFHDTQIFLLTRPSRGATSPSSISVSLLINFYSHAPRGARLYRGHIARSGKNFYSHAPRGARPALVSPLVILLHFYSHAPRGARPQYIGFSLQSCPYLVQGSGKN